MKLKVIFYFLFAFFIHQSLNAQVTSFTMQDFSTTCSPTCDFTTRLIMPGCIVDAETGTIPLETIESESFFFQENCFSSAQSVGPNGGFITNFFITTGSNSANNFLTMGHWPVILNNGNPTTPRTEGDFRGAFFQVPNGFMNEKQLYYTVKAKVKKYPDVNNPTSYLKVMCQLDNVHQSGDVFVNGANANNNILINNFNHTNSLHDWVHVDDEDWTEVILDIRYTPGLEEDILGQQIVLFNSGFSNNNLIAVDDIEFDCNQNSIFYTLDISRSEEECAAIYSVILDSECPTVDFTSKFYTVQIIQNGAIVTSFQASGQTFNFNFEGFPNDEYTLRIVDINQENPDGQVWEPEIDFVHDIENGNITDLDAPSFETTDEFGNPKSVFCYGEDVFIKIDESGYDYDALYFDTWLDPEMNTDWYNGLNWVNGISSGVYNYSQMLRDANQRPFDPEDEYFIKLAVDHPRCGWTENSASFRYICCDEDNLAAYSGETSNTPGDYTITGVSNADFTNYGGTHHFCLYTDVDQDGDFEQITCSSGTSFTYDGAEPGVRYYLVQWVETQCGIICFLQEFCVECNNAVGGGSISNSSLSCDNFEPPCIMNKPDLSCPDRIITDEGTGVRLEWTEVASSLGYQVDFIMDDPDCGCRNNEGEVLGQSFIAFENYIEIPLPGEQYPCFSFRVRAKCQGGGFSEWSEKLCYPLCESTDGLHSQEPFSTSTDYSIDDIIIYPNPFSNSVNIKVNSQKSEEFMVSLYSVTGDLQWTKFLSTNIDNSILVDDYGILQSGVYFAKIWVDGRLITQKVIKQ